MRRYNVIATVRRKWPGKAQETVGEITEIFGERVELRPMEWRMVVGEVKVARPLTWHERESIARFLRERASELARGRLGDVEIVDVTLEDVEEEDEV